MVLILERKRQDRISGLKETNRILTVEQRKIEKKNEQSLRLWWDNNKKANIHHWNPRRRRARRVFKKIIIKNKSFSSFIDTTYRFKIQEAE